MARSVERVALRLMKALKEEYEREPDALKCRPIGEIAHPICKSQQEFDRVMEFIGPRRLALIQAWRRKDGLAVQPNKAGLDWIKQQPPKVTLERVAKIVAIIFTVLAFLWGVFVWQQSLK